MNCRTFYLNDQRQDVSLTTYVLDSEELITKGGRPAVLVLPGGGYFNCSDREAEPVALAFNTMGYHAFVLRYSVWTRGKREFPDLSKNIEVDPDIVHPEPVREAGWAMRMIRDHAAEWNVDPEKIAVCGFSAGGHNAAMYGAYWNTDMVTQGKEAPVRPAALILGYPLTDYVFMRDAVKDAAPMDQAYFHQSNRAFLGEEESDGLLDEVSPARHVTKDFPPSFIFATTTDTMVPPQHSLHLAEALQNAGIPYELHLYEGGPHGLSLADQSTAVFTNMLEPRVHEWIRDCESWLYKRFAISLPDAPAWMNSQKEEN